MRTGLAKLSLLFAGGLIFPSSGSGVQVVQTTAQSRDKAVEVFQVLELPLNVQDAVLVKTDKGYVFKCSLSNDSELNLTGLRYTLIRIDSEGGVRPVANRTEGFSLEAYATKGLTFQTPIKLKLRDGDRLVVMLEQAVAPEFIWEVVKAKEALDAYAKGDYSVVPRIFRVANQIDAPMPLRVMYLPR